MLKLILLQSHGPIHLAVGISCQILACVRVCHAQAPVMSFGKGGRPPFRSIHLDVSTMTGILKKRLCCRFGLPLTELIKKGWICAIVPETAPSKRKTPIARATSDAAFPDEPGRSTSGQVAGPSPGSGSYPERARGVSQNFGTGCPIHVQPGLINP